MKIRKDCLAPLVAIVACAGILAATGQPALAEQDLDSATRLTSWQKGAIEGAFVFNPYLRGIDVQVRVQSAHAEIAGYVESGVIRALAEQVVLSIHGIDQVINRLVVAPEKFAQNQDIPSVDTEGLNRLSNVTITNKVHSQLLANRMTRGIEIDVQTQDRVVTISGLVTSAEERELAYWVVKNTQGVTNVVDQLVVGGNEVRQAALQLAE